tara:strand:- start:1788 stop:2465 length:678 start_codon:yes stop_codon:yes gene_type:complete
MRSHVFLASLLTVPCFIATPQGINADLTVVQSYLNTAVQVVVSDALGNSLGWGSGTIIKSDDTSIVVLTAKHVVKTPPQVKAFCHVIIGGIRSNAATTISLHDKKDAAILVIPHAKKEATSPIGLMPPPLTMVVTAGFPIQNDLIVSQGLLNFRSISEPDLWLCTANIAPGNSGAGVFVKDTGELIGISIAVATYVNGFNRQLITYMHLMLPLDDIGDWVQSHIS